MEQEVPARYVDLHSECHYLVDFDVSEVHADGMLVHGRSDDPDARMQVSQQRHLFCSLLYDLHRPFFCQSELRRGNWNSVFEAPFMNSGKTKLPGRAFFIPIVGNVHFDSYHVWRNDALFKH